MRIRLMFVALVLAACGEPRVPVADPGVARSVGLVAAERACAEITGHASKAGSGSQVDARREQEYRSCLASVAGDDMAAPPLRGRTAPPT